MALFSVVIPTYNRVEMLRRAVQSVLGQTFKDFELLVVDDCSTTDVAERLSDLQEPRLKVIRQHVNSGPGACRNTGILAATGQYIAFLDDDDEYLPDFLARTYACWQTAPATAGLTWSGVRTVRQIGERVEIVQEGVWAPRFSSREEAYRGFLRGRRVGTNCGLTVSRSAITSIGLFDETMRRAQDTDLLIRMARTYDFVVVPEVLVQIWDHEGPRAHRADRAGAEAYARIIQKHMPVLKEDPGLYTALHYKTGWQYYHAGDKRMGRRYMSQALRRSPFFLKGWLALLLFESAGQRATSMHRLLSQYRNRSLNREIAT